MNDSVLRRVGADRKKHVETLAEAISIPSISTLPAHAGDVRRAAEWAAQRARGMGFEAAVHATAGHPIMMATWHRKKGVPTFVVYGHYDVQAAEPAALWQSPPFELTERSGALYGRGTSDDKGQMVAHLMAIDAWLGENGELPVNVTLLFEGEEEVGSTNLMAFVRDHRRELACEALIISDTGAYDKGTPAITTGVRGVAGLDVTVRGPSQDVHSGLYGGAIQNPIHALARMIASLHDMDGRIRVSGFYDDVVEPPVAEREAWANLPFAQAAFLAESGAPALFGEPGRSTLERLWSRPTIEVNGITGGVQEGHKTIVPATARATITCRLVPNQDPSQAADAVRQHLIANAPRGVQVEVTLDQLAYPGVTPVDHPVTAAAARALREGFGKEPAYVRSGGSIPIVSEFSRMLGVPVVMMGFSLATDNIHGPNEHLDLSQYRGAIRSLACLWDELGHGLG